MRAATFVCGGNSFPGQEMTMPTHSMPEMGTDSAHSPRRMWVSAWFRPKALILMRSSPGWGGGIGMDLMMRFSGPPNLSMWIAFIIVSSMIVFGLFDLFGCCFEIFLLIEGLRWTTFYTPASQRGGSFSV